MNINQEAAMADDEWFRYYDVEDQQREAQSPAPKQPIRRRSRVSSKTPTTLLNANASNFRELVQHFTGCPTSFADRRGPVNLNFGLRNVTPIKDGPFQSSPLQQPYYYPSNMVSPHQQYSCNTATNDALSTFNDMSTSVLVQDDLSIHDFTTSDCIFRT